MVNTRCRLCTMCCDRFCWKIKTCEIGHGWKVHGLAIKERFWWFGGYASNQTRPHSCMGVGYLEIDWEWLNGNCHYLFTRELPKFHKHMNDIRCILELLNKSWNIYVARVFWEANLAVDSWQLAKLGANNAKHIQFWTSPTEELQMAL